VEMLPGTPRFALHPRLFRFRPVGAPEKDWLPPGSRLEVGYFGRSKFSKKSVVIK